MADNPQDRGAQDRSRINIHQEHEIRYWTRKFGVTEAELREAVSKAGPSAKAVAAALGKAQASD